MTQYHVKLHHHLASDFQLIYSFLIGLKIVVKCHRNLIQLVPIGVKPFIGRTRWELTISRRLHCNMTTVSNGSQFIIIFTKY